MSRSVDLDSSYCEAGHQGFACKPLSQPSALTRRVCTLQEKVNQHQLRCRGTGLDGCGLVCILHLTKQSDIEPVSDPISSIASHNMYEQLHY